MRLLYKSRYTLPMRLLYTGKSRYTLPSTTSQLLRRDTFPYTRKQQYHATPRHAGMRL